MDEMKGLQSHSSLLNGFTKFTAKLYQHQHEDTSNAPFAISDDVRVCSKKGHRPHGIRWMEDIKK